MVIISLKLAMVYAEFRHHYYDAFREKYDLPKIGDADNPAKWLYLNLVLFLEKIWVEANWLRG